MRRGHRFNLCIGNFLKSFPNLKESPGAMCFKKEPERFPFPSERLAERRLVALWMRVCIWGQVSLKEESLGVFHSFQAQSGRRKK